MKTAQTRHSLNDYLGNVLGLADGSNGNVAAAYDVTRRRGDGAIQERSFLPPYEYARALLPTDELDGIQRACVRPTLDKSFDQSP